MSGSRLPSRGRWRDILHLRQRPTLNPAPPANSAAAQPLSQTPASGSTTAASTSAATTPPQKIFAEAQKQLSPEHQNIIRAHVLASRQEILGAVQDAYKAAEQQKQRNGERKWTTTFRGRHIDLQDEAAKVLAWLNRFIAAGDVASDADPVHAGLPWAGIRLVLTATMANQQQMTSLFIGMELTLCLASRLEVYLKYFERLAAMSTSGTSENALAKATQNLETALVKLSTLTLRFLAIAIRTYDKNTLAQTWQALWEPQELEQLEADRDKLSEGVEIGANLCERELHDRREDDAKQWRVDLQLALKKLDDIQDLEGALNTVHIDAQLAKISIAKGAMYNSYAEDVFSLCLPGTRTALIQRILDWADDPNGKRILWLRGMAGTGKSTISRTIASNLDKRQRLGASFFFKRGERDRSNGQLFFSTVAIQLAQKLHGLSPSIAKAIESDALLCERNLRDQFDGFLATPLAGIRPTGVQSRYLLLVVDALDECERREDIQCILTYLAQLPAQVGLHLRIFVTSRPESAIRLGFEGVDGTLHDDIALEHVQSTTIKDDLRLFVRDRFDKIRKDDWLMPESERLPTGWPGNGNVETIVELSDPLFVSASTLCRWISGSDPQKRLQKLLHEGRNSSASKLEAIYRPILEQLLLNEDAEERKQIIAEFRQIAGTIILLADSLSTRALAQLLQRSSREIKMSLKDLHSVLDVPTDNDIPLRTLHLSFHDYLVDEAQRNRHQFWIDSAEGHAHLATQCLLRLGQPGVLKEDLLNLRKPGTERNAIDQMLVYKHIPEDVAYACTYWPLHWLRSGEKLGDNDEVHKFLLTHLLHWLEALSFLGRLSGAIFALNDLQSIVQDNGSNQLLTFLLDAKQLLRRSRYIVDLTPLQLYSSALVFLPSNNFIRRHFYDSAAQPVRLLKQTRIEQSQDFLEFDGHSGFIDAITFSPDNKLVASLASESDNPLCLWCTVTGEAVRRINILLDRTSDFHLDGNSARDDDSVGSWFPDTEYNITFSTDSSKIAVYCNTCVQIFNSATAEQISRFSVRSNDITTVTFSPNGNDLALGHGRIGVGFGLSCERSKRRYGASVWNIPRRRAVRSLALGSGSIICTAFSKDGQIITIMSADGDVSRWTVETGHELPGGWKRSVSLDYLHCTLSSDGQRAALVMNNRHGVCIIDTTTGVQSSQHTFKDEISSVMFPRDSNVVCLRSRSGVTLWNSSTGEIVFFSSVSTTHKGPSALFPDGRTFVETNDKGSIRLLAAGTRFKFSSTMTKQELPNSSQSDQITAIKFCSNGKLIAIADLGGNLVIHDTMSEKVLELDGGNALPLEIAVAADGSAIAGTYQKSSSEDLQLWHASGNAPLRWYRPDIRISLTSFALSANGQVALFVSGRRLHIVEVTSRSLSSRGMFHSATVLSAVALSSDGRKFVLEYRTGYLSIWTSDMRKLLGLRGSQMPFRSVALSPDDQYVAAISEDNVLTLWSQTGHLHTKFLLGLDSVCQLDFHPDGRNLMLSVEAGSRRDSSGRECLTLVSSSPERKAPVAICEPRLIFGKQWVHHLGENLLWLPPEHREYAVSRGDLLVVCSEKGTVSVFIVGPALANSDSSDV